MFVPSRPTFVLQYCVRYDTISMYVRGMGIIGCLVAAYVILKLCFHSPNCQYGYADVVPAITYESNPTTCYLYVYIC